MNTKVLALMALAWLAGSRGREILAAPFLLEQVSGITPPTNDSFPAWGGNLTNVNGTLYFAFIPEVHTDGVADAGLWKSNGTASSTQRVKDFHGVRARRFNIEPSLTAVKDGMMYFIADDGLHGYELWKSDGTSAGTVMVKDINLGAGDGVPGAVWTSCQRCYSQLVVAPTILNLNGTLYFQADDGTHGVELWKSDGTAEGTLMVRDIQPGSGSSWPYGLYAFQGQLYFQADDGVHGAELWRSDGTAAATAMVKDSDLSGGCYPGTSMTAVGQTLFYACGSSLWKTDGSEGGTSWVAQFSGVSNGTFISWRPVALTAYRGMLYFYGYDSTHGLEFWRSDGTPAGTMMVKDINPGASSSSPLYAIEPSATSLYMLVFKGLLYFKAHDAVNGYNLWRSDGSTVGTLMVKDTDGFSWPEGDLAMVSSDPMFFLEFNGSLLYNGSGYYQSDGMTSGTTQLEVLSGFSIGEYCSVDRTLYFFQYDYGNSRLLLWKLTNTGLRRASEPPDFDGDGSTDIFWRNLINGENYVWRSGNSALSMALAIVPTAYTAEGFGDFNGDGKSDIIWRNGTTGQLYIWRSGNIGSSSAGGTVNSVYTVAGTGDFNGDGQSDILWRNSSTGENYVWLSGEYAKSIVPGSVPTEYQVEGIGDFNGDGQSDILWRNQATGQLYSWPSGAYASSEPKGTVPLVYAAEAVGDYNGDGKSDILWRHATVGQNYIWWSGDGANSTMLFAVDPNLWQVIR